MRKREFCHCQPGVVMEIEPLPAPAQRVVEIVNSTAEERIRDISPKD
jgi:hypothetical protein